MHFEESTTQTLTYENKISVVIMSEQPVT